MTTLAPPSPPVLRASLIDPRTDMRWDEFVARREDAGPFHTAAWTAVLAEVYGYHPMHQILETESGEIAAGWPSMLIASRLTGTRLVSMPFSDHCAPLVSSMEDSTKLLAAVLDTAQSAHAGRTEVRGWPDSLDVPVSLLEVHGYVRHVIDLLDGPEAVFRRAHSNARRAVKRAEREGVTVRLADDPADMDTFVRLNLKLRRRHGMLPQPAEFFHSIYGNLVRPGHGYLLIAERQGVPLAAILCLRHGNLTIDKYAVSDSDLWEYRAPHYVMWKSIEMEAARGARSYDMGRSDASAGSLHWFKQQWGAREIATPYYFHPKAGGQNTEDPKGAKKRALDLFARIAPDSVFSGAGRIVYRHLG